MVGLLMSILGYKRKAYVAVYKKGKTISEMWFPAWKESHAFDFAESTTHMRDVGELVGVRRSSDQERDERFCQRSNERSGERGDGYFNDSLDPEHLRLGSENEGVFVGDEPRLVCRGEYGSV